MSVSGAWRALRRLQRKRPAAGAGALFVITALSVFITGVSNSDSGVARPAPISGQDADSVAGSVAGSAASSTPLAEASFWEPFRHEAALYDGLAFAAALLAILLAHEFGHYLAAKWHRVPASLPHFIPMPLLSPFGTMGAVIRMEKEITSRKALLDIGASGPLAGLVLAIPMYAWGVARSPVKALVAGEPVTHLGNSILLSALDRQFAPSIPEGHDVFLSPVAFAAWAGMFVTMINLIPAAQLDGGHVAYALLGPRQNQVARGVHAAMLLFFLGSLGYRTVNLMRAHNLHTATFGPALAASLFWFAWFQMLAILASLSAPGMLSPRLRGGLTLAVILLSGKAQTANGAVLWGLCCALVGGLVVLECTLGSLRQKDLLNHPETAPGPLGFARTGVAIVTLGFFALLFMPTPMAL